MSTIKKCFVVGASIPQSHTIILLHGRGSIGEQFAKDLFECEVSKPGDAKSRMTLKERFPSCRWIFPTAKPRYSTVFQEEMTEWFDVYSLVDPEQQADLQKPGLVDALQLLTALVHEEMENIDVSRLIIGGISQGFAMAATFMMALDLKCAGFIGLSGWIPFASQIGKAVTDGNTRKDTIEASQRATAAARELLGQRDEDTLVPAWSGHWIKTPIFIGHEKHDNIVAVELGETAHKLFQSCGANSAWRTYDSGDHWIQEPEEINDMAQFLDDCLKNNESH